MYTEESRNAIREKIAKAVSEQTDNSESGAFTSAQIKTVIRHLYPDDNKFEIREKFRIFARQNYVPRSPRLSKADISFLRSDLKVGV